MEPKQIDLNEWILTGEGNQGKSFINKENDDIVLKLFAPVVPKDVVYQEFAQTKSIMAAGVKCPPAYEFVKSDDSYGVIFKRVKNKKSFCRAIADDPSVLPNLAKRLADMGKDLHSKSAEGTPFTSGLDTFYAMVDKSTTADDDLKALITKNYNIVKKVETKTLVHGDYHFGNAITDGETDYFIDLGSMAYGNPDFDNSLLFMIAKYAPEERIMRDHHISKADGLLFWDEYKKAYYGENAPSDEEFEKRFAPYILLRTIFAEFFIGPADDLMQMRGYIVDILKKM